MHNLPCLFCNSGVHMIMVDVNGFNWGSKNYIHMHVAVMCIITNDKQKLPSSMYHHHFCNFQVDNKVALMKERCKNHGIVDGIHWRNRMVKTLQYNLCCEKCI